LRFAKAFFCLPPSAVMPIVYTLITRFAAKNSMAIPTTKTGCERDRAVVPVLSALLKVEDAQTRMLRPLASPTSSS
jgi:hypothetical protein